MQYKSPAPHSRVLNLTPLIDIIFLLLIFFMLTSHFVDEQPLPLALPSAHSDNARAKPDAVRLSLDQDGRLFIDGSMVARQQLASRLAALVQHTPERSLQLAADRHTPFNAIVYVLDTAQRLGLDNLEIMTEPP